MTNKYKNVKVKLDGYTFDSKKEASRYQDLLLLERVGEITGFVVKPPPYSFDVEDRHICKYYPDFAYIENGIKVIEDVKGKKTDVYKLKAKMMLAFYKIKVRET